MDFWFSERHTPDVKISLKVKKQLYSKKSDYQKIDVFDTYEFGKVLALDGNIMLTERDEFIYDEMITHVPMAVHPAVKRILVIGIGDGGVGSLYRAVAPKEQGTDQQKEGGCHTPFFMLQFEKIHVFRLVSIVIYIVPNFGGFVKGEGGFHGGAERKQSVNRLGEKVKLQFFGEIQVTRYKDTRYEITLRQQPFYILYLVSLYLVSLR